MKSPGSIRRLLIAGAVALPQAAFAHGPVFDCYLEGDDLVKCEAGYTDGSSAAGRKIHVEDASGKLLIEGVVGADNTYAFMPPSGKYSVSFMGGENHESTLQSADISK